MRAVPARPDGRPVRRYASRGKRVERSVELYNERRSSTRPAKFIHMSESLAFALVLLATSGGRDPPGLRPERSRRILRRLGRGELRVSWLPHSSPRMSTA